MSAAALYTAAIQSNPAVAISALIIITYKRRSVPTAQNADVAQTTVSATYLGSMEMSKQKHMCFKCTPQKQLRNAETPHYLHVIVLSRPNAYFCGMRSWPPQNKVMQHLNIFGCAKQ